MARPLKCARIGAVFADPAVSGAFSTRKKWLIAAGPSWLMAQGSMCTSVAWGWRLAPNAMLAMMFN